MSKRDDYRQTLHSLDDWEPYLLAESGLPGPRGNIELAQAVADEGDERLFLRLLSFDAAAGLCEPALLGNPVHAEGTLQILDAITASVARSEDRRSEDFQALRKGLAYCWSVAVAANPPAGKPLMERWLVSEDRDVRWIMRQNLAKQRLARVDSEWVTAWQARISLLKAIERSSGAWSDEDHPELKTDEDIDRFVRQLRESWKPDQLAST
jgi:hypothetical protein